MIRKILVGIGVTLVILAVAFVGFVWWQLQPRQDPQPLPEGLVAISAPEGRQRLAEAEAVADFDKLQAHYESQSLRSYCGVASGVAVLSALGKDVDQDSFFDGAVGKVRPRLEVMLGGMTLDDLAGLLDAHGAMVEARHADTFDAAEFREVVRRNLRRAGDYLLVNYQREVLGQRRVGHISPVSAYDADTDSVLIMDTASYNYPPTWVPVETLYAAMAATDPSSGKPRGFVEVSGWSGTP